MTIKQLTQPTSPSAVKPALAHIFTCFHHGTPPVTAVCCYCSKYKVISYIFYLSWSKNPHYLSMFYQIKSKFLCLASKALIPVLFNSMFPVVFPIILLQESFMTAKWVYSVLEEQAHSSPAAFVMPRAARSKRASPGLPAPKEESAPRFACRPFKERVCVCTCGRACAC